MRTLPSFRFSLVAVVFAMCCTSAFAARSDDEDPPDRVARLSYIKGDISLKPAGTDDWAEATLNRPLTSDDQLWLDRNARAELHTGASTIHLDENTAFSFSELSDDVLQMRITDGAMHLNVRRLRDGEVIEVDTPHAAVTVTRPGEYHIEVADDNSRTLVKTYSGECEVAGNGNPLRVREREQAVVDGSGQRPEVRERLASRDPFDNWAQERNHRLERSASARHVAPDVIGYEDLDDYGEWSSEPDYGDVWYPTRVVSGWSPYRFGHWVWISPWGWTWVDDAPWGFAPFHYGRWAFVRSRWCWVPGPVRVRPVYAPALVAWVGSPGVSVSVSIGPNIGWFPLAPHEVFVPSYHFSRRHLHDINYSNTVIVNNVIINRVYVNRDTHFDYRNRAIHDAVTVVPREHFVSARPVREHIVRANERDMREWRTRNVAPSVAPERVSVMGAGGPRDRRVVERGNERINRNVVSRREAPPRASFGVEQRAIQENNNRPVARRELFRPQSESRGGDNRNEPRQSRIEQRNDRGFEDRPRRLYDRSLEDARPNQSPQAIDPRVRQEPSAPQRNPNAVERTIEREPSRAPERRGEFNRNDGSRGTFRNERRNESSNVDRAERNMPNVSSGNDTPREQPQRAERREFERRQFERSQQSEQREPFNRPDRSGRVEMNERASAPPVRAEPPQRTQENSVPHRYEPRNEQRYEPRSEPQRVERPQLERSQPAPSRNEQREERRERGNPREFNRGNDRDR